MKTYLLFFLLQLVRLLYFPYSSFIFSLAESIGVNGNDDSGRPNPGNRTFTSPAIDAVVEKLSPLLADQDIAKMFINCFPNTLDTTVYNHTSDPLDSFIITGDITALWLRDSMNQVRL